MGTDIRKIKGKRIAHKAASWLQRTWYRNFQRAPKDGQDISQHPLYALLRSYRASEVAHIGPKQIVITGNSRMHGAEPIFETLIPSSVVTAISGDTAVGVHKRLADTVLAYRPRIVVDDSAGNDILGGAHAAALIPIKRATANEIRAAGAKVLFLDVAPVGAAYEAAHPGTNQIITEYNTMLRAAFPMDEVLPVADALSYGPYTAMRPEYDSGDTIHHSPHAYLSVYVPFLQERLLQLGFVL